MPLTTVFTALSNPLRLGVVRLLADGSERQWGEFDAPVSKSTFSHHIKVLRITGITATRAEGTRCYVHLRREKPDERFPGLLGSILDAQGQGAVPVRLRQRDVSHRVVVADAAVSGTPPCVYGEPRPNRQGLAPIARTSRRIQPTRGG